MSIKSEGGKKGSKISCGVETNTVAVTLEHWTLAAVTLESVKKLAVFDFTRELVARPNR